MKTQSVYRELTELIDSGRFCVLETAVDGSGGAIVSGLERHIAELSTASGESVEQSSKVTAVKNENRTIIREPIFPQERLIVLGGGTIESAVL